MTESDLTVVHTTAAYWLRRIDQPLVVDAEHLQLAAARGAIVWDVRSSRDHAADAPAGAISIGKIDWLLADPAAGALLDPESIARVLRRIGIRPGRQVVVYAGRAASAGFLALRALRSIGVESARVFLGTPDARSTRSAALQDFWSLQAMRHPARALVASRAPALELRARPGAGESPGHERVGVERRAGRSPLPMPLKMERRGDSAQPSQ